MTSFHAQPCHIAGGYFTLIHLHKFETHNKIFVEALLVTRLNSIALISTHDVDNLPSHLIVRCPTCLGIIVTHMYNTLNC